MAPAPLIGQVTVRSGKISTEPDVANPRYGEPAAAVALDNLPAGGGADSDVDRHLVLWPLGNGRLAGRRRTADVHVQQ